MKGDVEGVRNKKAWTSMWWGHVLEFYVKVAYLEVEIAFN